MCSRFAHAPDTKCDSVKQMLCADYPSGHAASMCYGHMHSQDRHNTQMANESDTHHAEVLLTSAGPPGATEVVLVM